MPGGPLFLGVDVGTQGTKALVYDQGSKKVVSRGARGYEIQKTKVPGRAEQHPSLWIKVCLICQVESLLISIGKIDLDQIEVDATYHNPSIPKLQ